MSDISIIKLVSGEELIADVQGLSPTTVSITTETLLAVLQPPQKQGESFSYGFLPWGTLTAEGKPIHLNRDLVLYVEPAEAKMVEHYKLAFSKLALPTQGLSIVR
jgi:hypothetical protein